jgi:hypothetical protein
MDNNIFPTTEQEAQRAANELYEIKVQVKELLKKLNQVEKRLKAVSPTLEIKKPQKNKPETKRSFSDEHLRDKYEQLSSQFGEDASNTIHQLEAMDRDELEALVKYLGVSVAKKPSQKKLVEMALGRLKESRLLRSDIRK